MQGERMIQLSASPSVFGVLTTSTAPETSKTGFLFLNAGLVHRPGPYRLHVELCRRLADEGYNCMRLDQSGRGDSERRLDMKLLDATILDVNAAIAELKKAGSERIIMGGLCAAADDAIYIAPGRDDIKGLIFLDGYVDRTFKYHTTLFFRRLRRVTPAKLIAFLKDRFTPETAEQSQEKVDETLQDIRNFPTPDEGRQLFHQFIDEDKHLLCVFTADVDEMYNYQGQLEDYVQHPSFRNNIEEHFLPAGKHVYPFVAQRRWLLQTILDWVRKFDT